MIITNNNNDFRNIYLLLYCYQFVVKIQMVPTSIIF